MTRLLDIRNQTPKTTERRTETAIKKIARHHSATPSGDFFAFWNGRWKGLGWGIGGYHEIILRDGSVQVCYDPIFVTNGVKGHNGYIYNICVVGNGSFTEAQEKAFDERCKLAMKRFNLTEKDVLGHNEFSNTSTNCPGTNMNVVRDRLKETVKKETVKEVNEFMKVAKLSPAQERMRQRLIRAGLLSPDYEIKEHELALMSILDLQQQRIEKLETR